MSYTIEHFFEPEIGMFYFTSDSEESLITRKIEVFDNVIPSSNSVLATSLFKLSHYYSNKDFSDKAKQMLSNVSSDIEKAPTAYSNWLNLYLNYSNPYYEIAIAGTNAYDKLNELNTQYLPNILIAGAKGESELPIMEGRYIEDGTYIYVCVNGACKLPVEDTNKAVSQLKK